MDQQAIIEQAWKPEQPNSGHGHVYVRPDKAVARCGGPRMCPVCAYDKERLKEREGDQRVPVKNGMLDCQTSLANRFVPDMEARRAVGIERYGTALQPLNGRDAIRDAYEEWLDLGVYLEQVRRENEMMRTLLWMIHSGEEAQYLWRTRLAELVNDLNITGD